MTSQSQDPIFSSETPNPTASSSSPSPIPSGIIIRTPTKFASASPATTTTTTSSPNASSSPSPSHTHTLTPPPLSWLERTWTVSHSTLPMWRKAKNVRITYKILPSAAGKGEAGPVRLDDLVQSVPTEKTWMPQPKEVRGVDVLVTGEEGEGWRWNWRGKGLLKIASSKWELLGYGETEMDGVKEKWAVTYFEATMFTPQGVDIYTDRKDGMGERLANEILRALVDVEAGGVGVLCKKDMRRVLMDDA